MRRIFRNIFWSHYFALFCGDFFKTFFACTIVVFLETLFHAFFSTIFWSRYSCEYKKRFFRNFLRRFLSLHFLLALLVFFWKNSFARFFIPILGHDIREIIKNVFSHFSTTIFSPTYFSRTIGVFLEKLFRAFFPPILVTIFV